MVGFVGENMDFFWLKRKWKEKGRENLTVQDYWETASINVQDHSTVVGEDATEPKYQAENL